MKCHFLLFLQKLQFPSLCKKAGGTMHGWGLIFPAPVRGRLHFVQDLSFSYSGAYQKLGIAIAIVVINVL